MCLTTGPAFGSVRILRHQFEGMGPAMLSLQPSDEQIDVAGFLATNELGALFFSPSHQSWPSK